MTKRDFEFIAATIKTMPDFSPNLRAQKASCTSLFSEALGKANPRFNVTKFFKACSNETVETKP